MRGGGPPGAARRPGPPAARGRPLHSAAMTTTLAPRVRCFSGIQPSGAVHIGNDLGAIRNYVALQDRYESIYCIVDFHALTSTHDPDALRQRTREMAAALFALGLDPDALHALRPEPPARRWPS